MLRNILTAYLLTALASTVYSPTFYGSKCSSDLNIEVRENQADIVLSGRVKAIHSRKGNKTYSCTLHTYRVIKGEDVLVKALNLPVDTKYFYGMNIEVYGFGNSSICDSDVTHGDTRVVMITNNDSHLALSSSLIRVRPQTLRRKSYSQSGQCYACKPFLYACTRSLCIRKERLNQSSDILVIDGLAVVMSIIVATCTHDRVDRVVRFGLSLGI